MTSSPWVSCCVPACAQFAVTAAAVAAAAHIVSAIMNSILNSVCFKSLVHCTKRTASRDSSLPQRLCRTRLPEGTASYPVFWKNCSHLSFLIATFCTFLYIWYFQSIVSARPLYCGVRAAQIERYETSGTGVQWMTFHAWAIGVYWFNTWAHSQHGIHI